MPQVEQAIFTSAETARSVGYQVVARSPGVCEADTRELAIWGPSHDSLLDFVAEASSISFYPLPSGASCVSRTTAAGWEYSGRGGHRVYTQCLIMPAEVLARFANNPFALIRAAQASGMLEVFDRVPGELPAFDLPGGAAPVDQNLLARLATTPGPARMATLLQAALDSVSLALSGKPSPGELIAGVINCLPVECRREFSFSTGLKYSSRRPYRIVALSGDEAEHRWVAHHQNVSVLDLDAEVSLESLPLDGWAQLIGRALASRRTSFLAAQLSEQRHQLGSDDLSALGLQLLEELDATALRCDGRREIPQPANEQVPDESDRSADRTHAHAAHQRFEKSSSLATLAPREELATAAPSKVLTSCSQEVVEKLEHLDDLVYEAVGGRADALEELQTVWPQLLSELGEELVVESRQQYLRYALAIWENCVESAEIRNPARAVQALDVLCVLFDDTQRA